MNDSAPLHRAADCVLAVETAMREAGLWHDHVPTPAAMASRTPFCADTLDFSQWLQFVFIPRMRSLIEAGGPLPEASSIAVMAEARLDTANVHAGRVVTELAAFDRLISERA
ncbi:YqcC family protein [Salinisphaera sp. Q1T1-3]|uniref:YqcC family protein n=1 Tax=Salinisphaera sp. Q1T1-3 TaxID=2321229 RepID=UPI000E752CC7|nr:YqcC family protein [Salinisphaera sp. Q1T1-3]RJS94335.1 YqcC family protein [Salinisphaera sp. Q1T1-3]